MHQPQEVWGVHVVQGAAIAVKLRRTAEGGFEIDSAYLEPNDGKTLPVHVASMMLARPGLKGEPAVVALPDAAEFLATVRVPHLDAERTDEELAEGLHKSTHFEFGHATLRHHRVMRDGDADIYLVAAQPKSAIAAAVHEFEHKTPLPAIAFGGAAVIRGTRALGLAPDPCVLVEIESHVTVAYFVDHGHVRRRSVPHGEREILGDAKQLDALVEDLLKFADARSSAAGPEHPMSRPVPFVLVGPGTASNGVRQRLAGKLGDRLKGGKVGDARVKAAQDGRLHHVPLPALVGAVGAALEALVPAEERMLVRDLPADLTPKHEKNYVPHVVAAAVVGVIAVAGLKFLTKTEPEQGPSKPAKTTAAAAPTGDGTGAPATGPAAAFNGNRDAAPPAEARPAGPRLTVESLGPGRVRVGWPAGAEGRVLSRFDVNWRKDRTLGAEAGWADVEVTGPSQLYGWRIDEGDAVYAKVEVPVEVELLGATAKDGGRFLLRRSWNGAPRTVTVEVAPGEPIRGTSKVGDPAVDLVFDTGCWLVGVHPGTSNEKVAVRVPKFNADGTVERGPDKAALLVDRVLEMDRPVVRAEATTGDGSRKTWTKSGS